MGTCFVLGLIVGAFLPSILVKLVLSDAGVGKVEPFKY